MTHTPASINLGAVIPAVSQLDADKFLCTWFGGREGQAVLTRISSAGRHVVRSFAMTPAEMVKLVNGANDFETLCADDGGTWNVYVSCSLHSVDPTKGGGRRGGKSTVDAVHGVWLDLDVKDEAFNSGEEIDAFLATLGVEPTLVVDSGSGGRHVYWRFLEGALTVEDGERMNEAWWAYACEKADGVYIDKTTTCDRIMRLPGTLRWPKQTGDAVGQVRLLRVGSPASITAIWEKAANAYTSLVERRASTRERLRLSDSDSTVALGDLAEGSGWDQLLALAYVEDMFNETATWERILVPFGWKWVGTDHEGRRQWARPGQDRKSAHTDYPGSPHVMKLFSNAPTTGLSALLDAGIPLTKFRVYCQLAYGGDSAALIRVILDLKVSTDAAVVESREAAAEAARVQEAAREAAAPIKPKTFPLKHQPPQLAASTVTVTAEEHDRRLA